MSPKLSWITSQHYFENLHAPCASQASGCVLCAKLLQCCCPRAWPARDPGATQRQANTFLTLHIALFTPHTPHFTLHLNSSHLSSSHLISCLPICQLSFLGYFHVIWAQLNLSHLTQASLNSSRLFCTESLRHRCIYTEESLQNTLYHKACTKHAPVLLCTTKLAQTTSQYYCALQGLHKVRPSTTLYYTACTKHVPVPLCTTELALSTSQYHFVLQSLHKVVPSTTLYYTACTKHFPALLCTTMLAKHFPVLLCTTQLAQSTSQYYFVLRSLHKALPSTTLYYTACTKHFPVLLCTTKLAQKASQQYFVLHKACTQYYLILQSLKKVLPSTTLYYEACAKHFPALLCTTKLAQSTFQYYFVIQSLHKESFHTQQVLSQRNFYTQQAF